MVQPIQYGIQAPSAFESLVSGLRLGTSLQQIQLQREQQMAAMQQAQEKAEAERQRQARLQMLRGKSFAEWTPDDVLSASDLLPKESLTFLKGQMDQMSTEERRARALTLGQLGSVALMGDAERTAAAFDERIEAETNPREKEALRAQKQIALTRPEDLAKMYVTMLPAMGDEGKQVADNILKVRGLEAKKPEATPEILRAIDALGLPRNLESIRKYSEATQRPEALTALQKAQAYRQTLQQQGKQNSPEYAENEQYIRNQLVDPTALTQAQIEANRIAQARLEQADRLNDPTYRAALAAAEAEGRARGESAASKVAQQNAAVATLASIGYNPETGEDDISRLIARSTSGGLQAGAAAIARFWGASTEGMNAINELQAAASSITTDILGGRLGAGISNTDREFILAGLGDVGNEQKTAGERYAGWTRAKNRMVQVGMLPKPKPRGAAQQQTQTPQPAPAGGAPRQPTVSNW